MKRAGALFTAALLALAGCSGKDGAPGPQGQDGTSCTVRSNGDGTATVTCTDGTTATVADGTDGTNGVSCTLATNADGTRTVTCPDGGVVVLPAVALAGKVLVTDQAAVIDGADVVVTFKVALNGVASGAFTNKVSAYRSSGASSAQMIRTSIATTDFTVTSGATGYTARFPGLATTVGSTPTTYLIRLNTGPAAPAAAVVAHSAAGKPKSTVSDQACMNCHGTNVFHALHEGGNPQGVGACVVCHVRADRSETRLGTGATITDGAITAPGTAPGTRLMGYVHGIHNSHNMPAHDVTSNIDPDGSSGPLPPAPYTVAKPEGVYARNNSLRLVDGVPQISSPFSIGFPSYMNNCSTCHDTQENLDLVLAKPLSYQTCISCHDGWNGFGTASFGTVDHTSFNAATTCTSCHGTPFSPKLTVADFHNGDLTQRSGLLWDGKDQSIEEGKKIAMEITGITRDDAQTPNRLVITWTAKNPATGASYDPCNSDYAAGPVFFGKSGLPSSNCTNTSNGCNSNLSVLRAYAQGNDWVNAGVGSSPGQPGSAINVVAPNADPAVFTNGQTTCTAGVAATVVNVDNTTATKGTLALQGKPQVKFTNGNVIWTRSPSPTREFVVATGAEPAGKRRPIVDSQKCLGCHQGSLYQHGGNRVDNVELCVMCHNPASNEKNNRVNMTVDASEAYDGKTGQTYDLRYMLHAVHSAGETGAPLVYYRTNGIYLFGSKEALAKVSTWPGTGCQVVAGSGAPSSATGAQCDPANTTAVTKNHNFVEVHYPRALNDCGACHVSSSVTLPSTSTAVAVTTYDAGVSPWGMQTDDVLMSPATASCMSCHQSGDAAMQSALRAHAYQNSWTPAVFTNGREDILGGGAAESCVLCHGAGNVADFNAAHGN